MTHPRPTARLRLLSLTLLMLLAAGPAPAFHKRRAAGLTAAPASAATTWQVTPGSTGACTPADPNCATIQAAVNAASNGDAIQVAAGTYAEHVTVSKGLSIGGAGAGATTVDGTQSGTVFTVTSGAVVSLSGMTVSNGKSLSMPSFTGGGIHNAGTLSVTDSTVRGNSTTSRGGGIHNVGTMNIVNSTVSGNSGENGGGIYNERTLNITDSTVSGNSATTIGGILNFGVMNVTNSAVSHNSALNGVGGIDNTGTMNIVNSTVSGNSAVRGSGGIHNFGATLSITNSTVSGNSGENGGGISNHVSQDRFF